jgi:polar amino acid transport system substrate-binding protein
VFDMLKRLLSLGTMVFVAFFATLSFAQDVTDANTLAGPPDLAGITERGKLVIAMTSFDNAPFYSVKDGHLEGIDVDLGHDIAEALGVEVEFDRSAETFNDVVAKVKNGEADIAISKISRTNARAMVVAFSTPYVRLKNALMFNRLKLAQKSQGQELGDYVRNFDGNLGVIEKSSFANFAKIRFPKANIVPFKTWAEVVDATIAGQVDAAYRDEFEVRRIAEDRPETSISLRTVTIADARDSIAVAAPWNAPRLLAIINQVIDDRSTSLTADDVIALYRKSIAPEGEH